VSEIIVIDDCSIDSSPQIIDEIKTKNKIIKTYRTKKNSGKGRALKCAKGNITNKYVVIHDADLEYHPKDFYKMFEIIKNVDNSFIIGSRFLQNNSYSYLRTYLANIFLSKLFSILFGVQVSDISTCYKMMDKEFYNSLSFEKNSFDIEVEIIASCFLQNKHYEEVPIDYTPRSYQEGKKISYIDGLKYIYSIIQYRFSRK